jgi:hypothetical protein
VQYPPRGNHEDPKVHCLWHLESEKKELKHLKLREAEDEEEEREKKDKGVPSVQYVGL